MSEVRRPPSAFCYAGNVLRIHKSAWLLVLLSAVLQILVFPLPNLYFLGWAALAPLLIALLRAREPDTLQLLRRSQAAAGKTGPGLSSGLCLRRALVCRHLLLDL